jgi:cellulose binding protein with CBM2 domain/glycosyl hydrolase family 12
MKRIIAWIAVPATALVAALLVGVGAAPAATWTWCSSDQWGTWTDGSYTLYNDIWGSGAGTQTICANSHSNWEVTADHPNTGGVKSYPNASIGVNQTLSSLSSVTSNFNVTVPSSGAYETAYDIWAGNNAYEIMLWMNKTGAVGPLGSEVATATVGGHTWDVYSGSNGSNQTFSFVRTSNTSSGTVDILAVLKWIESQGWYGDVTLGNVQFGYEITSSAGGLTFTTNSYGVTYSGSGSGTGGAACSASYAVNNDWGSGATATVTVANTGTVATNSWRVSWTWPGGQQVTNAWNATMSQSGSAVTASNAGYNGGIAAGSSTSFGFQISYSGSNSAPALTCTAS